MDIDDLLTRTPADPLTLLARQDLDPLSVEELRERLDRLDQEILRVKKKLEGAVNHRASADALFKR